MVWLKLFIGFEIFAKLEAVKIIYSLEGKSVGFSSKVFLAVITGASSVFLYLRKARNDVQKGYANILTRIMYTLLTTVIALGIAYTIANKIFEFEIVPLSEHTKQNNKSLKQILNE
jgi:preprotein translocase subunit SecG